MLLATLSLVALSAAPTEAYLKLGTTQGGRTVTLRWNEFPIRYFVTDAAGGGISAEGLRDALGRAFATWESVETADVTSSFGGFTNARPNDDDGLTVIGFVNRADQDRTLGATSFLVDVQTGEIIESEIYFNSFFNWSVAGVGDFNADGETDLAWENTATGARSRSPRSRPHASTRSSTSSRMATSCQIGRES